MSMITKALVEECKGKLLKTKEEILNRVQEVRKDLYFEDKGGDEADQTARILNEKEILTLHDRLRQQLFEIEQALSRIETGGFGVCEETEEQIEPERLRAIPWTRLSIEGAELRESMKKRYAQGGEVVLNNSPQNQFEVRVMGLIFLFPKKSFESYK